MKILHLSLKKQPFEVMATGEKTEEFRKPSKWIESRLFDKNGNFRKYDFVVFTNGYGKHRPSFTCEFKQASKVVLGNFSLYYSNGLNVTIDKGDYIIYLGKIIKTDIV